MAKIKPMAKIKLQGTFKNLELGLPVLFITRNKIVSGTGTPEDPYVYDDVDCEEDRTAFMKELAPFIGKHVEIEIAEE